MSCIEAVSWVAKTAMRQASTVIGTLMLFLRPGTSPAFLLNSAKKRYPFTITEFGSGYLYSNEAINSLNKSLSANS